MVEIESTPSLCPSLLGTGDRRPSALMAGTLVYTYLTYNTVSTFEARISADSHILVQQTIPFSSFDAVWYLDPRDGEYYRLLVSKGHEQLVLSVKNAKKIATVSQFDQLFLGELENILPDDSSPDKAEIRKLLTIKSEHTKYQPRLHPGIDKWNVAISLVSIDHRPDIAPHACRRHKQCYHCACIAKAT